MIRSVLLVVGVCFGVLTHACEKEESKPESPSKNLQLSNSMGQELFEAKLVKMSTTDHRRFMWALTFRRLLDCEEYSFNVPDTHPLAAALGFEEWKDGSEGVKERIAEAPTVVLILRSVPAIRGLGDPTIVLDGWMVIDKQPAAEPATPSKSEPEPSSEPLRMSNSLGQKLFEARLTDIATTNHHLFKWAMTFQSLHDCKQVYFELLDGHPLPAALGFKRSKDAREGVQDRIAKAPPVVLITSSPPQESRDLAIIARPVPKSVLDGWMVIDKKAEAQQPIAPSSEQATD